MLIKRYDDSYYPANSAGEHRWGEPKWHAFFDHVAEAIVSELDPKTVLDASCGIGFLVAALRQRGVEAWGIDTSEYAISQVPMEFRSYCAVASLAGELARDYDLIVCIEMPEHLPPDSAVAAVRNLAKHTDSVLFSTSSTYIRDPKRPDVQRVEDWIGLFAEHGFFRNLDLDAAFMAPQAIHLRRAGQTAAEVARAYERSHWHILKEVRELRVALRELESTRTFRYTTLPRRIYAKVRALRDRRDRTYGTWTREFDTLSAEDCRVVRDDAERLEARPLISVLMTVHNPPGSFLKRAIESVRSQLYESWELCVADDASTDPDVRHMLREYAVNDRRVKVVFREERGNISAASNSALELCTGEFVARLGHDDELPSHALYLVAREIGRQPDAAIVFSDEDMIDKKGRRTNPSFKPDWNPDLFRSQNCINHLGVYRRSVLREAGGFRVGFEGSQDYDLALRIVERVRAEQIRHIPAVLYHRRVVTGYASGTSSAEPGAGDAARAALVEHARRTGRSVEVVPASDPTYSRMRFKLPADLPFVSIVIPTRDGAHLEACVESVRTLTTYGSYEVIVVDNRSAEATTKSFLGSLSDAGVARILEYDDVFSHSAICNLAAGHARGEVLCLLNDDVEVLTPGWLEELVSHAIRPEVGAVGAKLVYPDGRIQHAGVVLGVGEVAGHAHRFEDSGSEGYLGRAALVQNYSAVTGACLVIRASVYAQVAGFDEVHLPHIYNDVDFCLRLRESGYWNVWTPYATLVHHESATLRPPRDPNAYARHRKRVEYMRARWGPLLANDPAYNPNLTLASEDFALAWPPRTAWPWSRQPNGKALTH